jgi:putative MFS transporter
LIFAHIGETLKELEAKKNSINFVTVEQFGTNMRATMATSAFSTGRATLIVVNLVYLALHSAGLSVLTSVTYIVTLAFGLGFLSLLGLRETYHQGMDFLEEKVSVATCE